jgi:hypothetical protein
VTGIDADEGHVRLAPSTCSELGFGNRVDFVVGAVADVLPDLPGPVDAIHDDAWFASALRTWRRCSASCGRAAS